MKNLFLLTVTLFISTCYVFSQDDEVIATSKEVKLSVSTPYPVFDGGKSYFPVGENEILAVKTRGDEFVFHKFSGENLDFQSEKIEIIKEKGYTFEDIRKLKDKLYLFYSVYDKPNKTEQLFCREIDTEAGGFKGEATRVIAVNQKITGILIAGYFSYRTVGKFSFDRSNDSSKLVIRYRLAPDKKDDSKNFDVLGMHIFDENMSPVWDKEVEMPYTESQMDNLDFSVDQFGNGYFLSTVYKEANMSYKERIKPENSEIELFKVTTDGNIETAKFDTKNFKISTVSLFEDPKGNMICAGYYKKPKSYGVDGAFVAKVKKDGEIESPQLYEFSLEFIKEGLKLSARQEKKLAEKDAEDKLAINNLYLRNFKALPDGSIILSGEIYYVTTTTDSKGNTRTTYHYDDVYVTKIKSNGELDWHQRIPKRSTQDTYKYVQSGVNSYIVFVKPISKEFLTSAEVDLDDAKGRKQPHLVGYQISPDGKTKQIVLFNLKDVKGIPVYQFSLNRIFSIADNSFAVELYKKAKEDVMIKVELE